MRSATLRTVAGVIIGLGLAITPAAAQEGAPHGADDAATAQTWSVQPADKKGADGRPSWDYTLDPGESVDDVVQVNNFSTEAVTFRLYSHDAINTRDGGFTLQPADVEPAEVGAWIGLDEKVTIEPGDSALVPFRLSVPDDAAPGDHAGGIIASVLTESTNAQGQRVLVDNRVGSRVYLRVAGAVNPALAITGMDVDYERSWLPLSTGDATVTYEVKNIGNVRLSGEQKIAGHGLFGLGEHTVTLDDVEEILPGQAVTVTTQIEDVAPLFRITEEVTVNPQPPETAAEVLPVVLATAAVSVWAMPWPELIIVGLVALGIAWSWWRRRRQKQRTAAMMDEAVTRAREQLRRELQRESAATGDPESSGDGESSEGEGASTRLAT